MLQKVNEALEELISNYQQNPLDFFFESDLQAFLFMKLRGSIDKKIALSSGVFRPEMFEPGKIETSLVHTEYPSNPSDPNQPQQFDVAVIEPELTQNGFSWNLLVRVAIELKHVRIDWKPVRGFQGLSNDLTKLNNYTSYYEKGKGSSKFTGIGVLFIQSCAPDICTWIQDQSILPTVGRVEQTDKAVYAGEGISGYVVTHTVVFIVRRPCDG